MHKDLWATGPPIIRPRLSAAPARIDLVEPAVRSGGRTRRPRRPGTVRAARRDRLRTRCGEERRRGPGRGRVLSGSGRGRIRAESVTLVADSEAISWRAGAVPPQAARIAHTAAQGMSSNPTAVKGGCAVSLSPQRILTRMGDKEWGSAGLVGDGRWLRMEATLGAHMIYKMRSIFDYCDNSAFSKDYHECPHGKSTLQSSFGSLSFHMMNAESGIQYTNR